MISLTDLDEKYNIKSFWNSKNTFYFLEKKETWNWKTYLLVRVKRLFLILLKSWKENDIIFKYIFKQNYQVAIV